MKKEQEDMKNKLIYRKLGVPKSGFPPKRCPPKFKLFNLLSWTHEIFKVTKYKRKIKFDQILGYQNWRSPQTKQPKFKSFY